MDQVKNNLVCGTAESMIECWKHFRPCGLVFLTSLTPDDGRYDQGALSEMANSDSAAASTMLLASVLNAVNPRLRCLRSERELSSYDEVFITKAIFHAIDATLTGDPSEDADTLIAIADSLLTDNDAYMQSRFRFAEIGGWQPNFFNPSIKTNKNHVILSGYQNTNYSNQNAGDLSVGAMLPFVFEPRFPVSIGKVPDDAKGFIVIRAACAQLVEGNRQPYPIVCELELIGYTKGRGREQ